MNPKKELLWGLWVGFRVAELPGVVLPMCSRMKAPALFARELD